MTFEIDVWGLATASYFRRICGARHYRSARAALNFIDRVHAAMPDGCAAAHPIAVYRDDRRDSLAGLYADAESEG